MRYIMIYYPKTYGTCSGANKAINLAYKLKKEHTDKKYIYIENKLINMLMVIQHFP